MGSRRAAGRCLAVVGEDPSRREPGWILTVPRTEALGCEPAVLGAPYPGAFFCALVCEHVFALSIKGRRYTWLLAAIRRGDLAGVRAAAAELDHEVNLADALSIVLVMANRGDLRYDRAAVRWLARLACERPGVGLEDLRFGLTA